MGKSAGAPSNYSGAAEAQSRSSREAIDRQTEQNRPGVNTPFMQQRWTTGPDGRPQLSNELSGGLGTGASATMDQAGQALSQGMDSSLFAPIQSGQQARDQAISSAFNDSMARLEPMMARRESGLAAKLSNQGLSPTSQAYRNATGDFGAQRNDAVRGALANAISQGTEAGNTALMGNIASSQANINNQLTRRRSPLQDLGLFQGLMSTPQFALAGAADPTQYLQAAQMKDDFNMRNAEMQNQMMGDLVGGLMSGVGSFAAMSDERLKTNIVRHSTEAIPGVHFASWEWKDGDGERNVGVIAQDLQKVRPDMVIEGEDGFLRVDYGKLFGGLKK